MESKEIISKIKSMYGEERSFIPLHEPTFCGNEKKYLIDCIDSTFVSSVGAYVDRFERDMAELTGAKYAIATMNGTAALHLALMLAEIGKDDLVVTQAISFVATVNAILYTGATPYFIDIDESNLGMSPESLNEFLKDVELVGDSPIHKPTGKRIGGVVPMHTFGFPTKIDEIVELCAQYNIPVIEDAAESLGSSYKGKQTGTFGTIGVFSFNGNKTITSGGGGILVTDNPELAKKAKHISTQAKVSHPWEYKHDALGFNFRCPNINAALACAQLENLKVFIENKRKTAKEYQTFFEGSDIRFVKDPKESISNCWLNAIIFPSEEDKLQFLQESNDNGVMTRPVWSLLTGLPYLKEVLSGDLKNSIFIEKRLVNIPSSVRL